MEPPKGKRYKLELFGEEAIADLEKNELCYTKLKRCVKIPNLADLILFLHTMGHKIEEVKE